MRQVAGTAGCGLIRPEREQGALAPSPRCWVSRRGEIRIVVVCMDQVAGPSRWAIADPIRFQSLLPSVEPLGREIPVRNKRSLVPSM